MEYNRVEEQLVPQNAIFCWISLDCKLHFIYVQFNFLCGVYNSIQIAAHELKRSQFLNSEFFHNSDTTT